jgi:ABC-type lipoprotein export system ATPase subunit
MTSAPLISVVQASKVYRVGQAEIRALDAVTVDFFSGQLIGIVGPSGSGKTTFLMIAGLLDCPSDGAVFFRNELHASGRRALRTGSRTLHPPLLSRAHKRTLWLCI